MGPPKKWEIGITWNSWALPIHVGMDIEYKCVWAQIGPLHIYHCWSEDAE